VTVTVIVYSFEHSLVVRVIPIVLVPTVEKSVSGGLMVRLPGNDKEL
jgi:hypothetical protein